MFRFHQALAITALLLSVATFEPVLASNVVLRPGSPYIVGVWGTEDGLPQSSVIAVTQTRDGYLWLGTLNGLVRFDGVRFTVFDEGNAPELGSSRIVSLFEDSQGNLWVGTETAGVALIKDGQIKSLNIGRGSREGRLVSACQDATGAVWLYTADGELCRHSRGSVDVWKFGAQNPSSYRAVIAEQAGPLWLGVDWGLYGLRRTGALKPRELPALQYVLPVGKLDFLLASQRGGYWRLADGRVQQWTTNHLERDWGPYPWRKNAHVSAACEDREGNLVVGTLNENDGVYWYGPDGKAARVSSAEGLSHDGILSLCVDREGNLWVGTDGGGLNRVKRRAFEVAKASRGWVVQSACADAEGGLWMGFNGGIRIGAAYQKNGLERDFGPDQGLMDPNVWSMFVDPNQRVWAGTWLGLFQLEDGRFQRAGGSTAIRPPVGAVHQDRSGQLWFGTQGGLLCWNEREWKMFTTRDGLSSDVVRAIADDSEGNLWIGTGGGGLNCLRDGKFTVFRKKDKELPSDNISSLYADDEGVLWIGTGNGLARLHAGKWTRYTKDDGLASNGIGYLLEDGQGYLWIGSNAGLMRVPKKALNAFTEGLSSFIPCRVYGRSDGLPTAECTSGSQPAACRTVDGMLWFPTVKGLVSVNSAELKPNTNPPPVVIESVLVDGREQNTNSLRTGWLQTLTIPPGKERLEIRYSSLNLAAPDKARFKYRMEGYERDWTDAGDRRVVPYTKLPPGHYRFQVAACNEDGAWNETGSALTVIVEPPFWRTWWFLGASAACLLGMIIGTVHYFSTQKLQRQLEKLRQREAIEKERSRIGRDLHDQLGANLTQVSLLGELVEADKDSPDEVETHARQISQTARDTTRALDEIVWAANPANDTLDGLITYACKCAQEYLAVAGLRYRLEVPGALPGVSIPPDLRHNVFLAFKEALTNVVKHAQASEVWVRLRLQPDRFVLEVQDDGRGLAGEGEQPGRNGLRNMRKRMEDVGGEFFVGPAPEGGTLVRLTAPLRNS